MPLYISVATSTLAECAGTSFTGSATIGVCGIHSEKQEKVLKAPPPRAKAPRGGSMGPAASGTVKPPILRWLQEMWIAATKKWLTSWLKACLESSSGTGAISKKNLWRRFLAKGSSCRLISKNMKKLPAKLVDAILLRKRAIIENVNDFLKIHAKGRL